jgi:biotin carboxylase
MKRLLYLGGSHSDIPLIMAARELGFYVITTGNKADDLGHKYANQYEECDYSDKEAVLELAKRLKVEYLCPCCNDFSMISCSYVAEKLSIPFFDPLQVTETIHHKDKFREFCMGHNFPVPKSRSFTDIDSAIEGFKSFSLPVIVKPIDLTGGKGVARIDQLNDAPKLIQKAFEMSKQKKVVIEEFIEGTNHGLSTFIINKKVAFYFYDDEHYYLNKYLVSGASCPSSVSEDVIERLCKNFQEMATLLDLKDGIFHCQFILKDNTPFITEICRRPPGDLYVKLVEYATGVRYSNYIIRAFTGVGLNDISHRKADGFITRHCIMCSKPGKIKEITFAKDIKDNIFDSLYLLSIGDTIHDHLNQKVGIVFIRYSSLKEMQDKVPYLQELIKVEID